MKLILVLTAFSLSHLAQAELSNSSLVLNAHKAAHELAAQSSTRSLPMFNYIYYSEGFCRDQVCTEEKIKAETDAARSNMGADFDKLNKNRLAYSKLIRKLQKIYSPSDLASLNSIRSAEVIVKNGIFLTANDMSKAIIYIAQKMGEPAKNLRFMVLMVKEGYLKMCPQRDGRAPILPRPIVYAVVAFKNQNNWYALNPENEKVDLFDLGATLPARLSAEISYEIPAPMKGKILVNAGAYRATTIDGFTSNELIAMTASGQIEDDLASVQCL